MVEFFQAGGFGMWIVLGLGIAALGTAAMFARKPDERRMSMIRSLTWATIFSTTTAFASNLSMVFYTVPGKFADAPDPYLVAMQGMAESLAPVIMGSAFLTLTWLVASVGMRRLSERLSEVPASSLS